MPVDLVLIEVEGRVAGMVQLWEEQEPRYRHAAVDVFLDPVFHGRDIGTEAVRAYERDADGPAWHDGLLMEPVETP